MPESNSITPPVPAKSIQSVVPGCTGKPKKPSADFPLTAHPRGQWCKKIKGRIHYFGPWNDPEGARAKYEAERADLEAGRKPRPKDDDGTLTVKKLVNKYLTAKQAKADNGELSPRTVDDYREICELLGTEFGPGRAVSDLGPDDFAALRSTMAKRWGPVRLGNTIQRVRSVFKYADDAGLIERPIRFGPDFQRPSAKVLRLHKAKQGAKLFTADEIRRIIDNADVQLKAMVLLGINCGFGLADCGRLPLSALDLETGWIDFPRPKTGIPRRCPLWPETVEAIKAALAVRPEPKNPDYAEVAFLTAQRRPWFKEDMSSPLVWKVKRLLKALKINGRNGLGFYTLRHTFRTVADEARDQPAADFLMGHARNDMASIYRERIDDARLHAVVDHVHRWLFGKASASDTHPTVK